MTNKTGNGVTKKALWGVIAFYLLIAFEIAYMAGPFAVYFYGVYNPVLNFFDRFPALTSLNSFIFPHVARETSSAFLNIAPSVGGVIAAAGFLAFLIGACQIYYSKFTRKGAVTGGVYNRIRHPQYVSFAVCGLGLLIVWPRVINLMMFVTMLFVYYLLAKAEERECEAKFGETYIDYKNKTNMFFPFSVPKLPSLPKGKKAILVSVLYVVSMIAAFFGAKAMTGYFVNSLYAVYTEDTVSVSLSAMENDKLEEIMSIASTAVDLPESALAINYVLPTEWFAAEVPMNGLVYRAGHRSPADYDDTQYKVIFTAVQCDGNPAGKEILTSVREREPLAEVWVDLDTREVTQVLDIPEDYKYRGVPVSVY